MALRLFDEDTSWEQARRDTRYTAASLAVDETHAKQARSLRELLDRWSKIEEERRAADDAVVDGHALVHAVDAQLDLAVLALAARLRFELGQGRARADEHPTFRRFFPEAPSEVVRMGLEAEVERTKRLALVAGEVETSKEVQAILKTIARLEAKGTDALARREEAVAAASRVSLRCATWKESANASRRSVENILDAHATAGNLPRDYADAFFPARGKTRRKPEPDPAHPTVTPALP